MKYMLLVYHDELAPCETEREHCYVESAQLTQDLNANEHYLAASPLHPTTTAIPVRVSDAKRLLPDLLFAGTREQLATLAGLQHDVFG
jgi:hypothetical protein